MKLLIILLITIVSGILSVQAQENRELSGTVKIEVKGLSCPFCVYGLEKNLKEIPSVEKVGIDIEEGLVTLLIEDGKTVLEETLKKKVKDAGFTPGDIKNIVNE